MIKSFSLHEPSREAAQTIESILVPGSHMKLMPTHCINASGELEGFQLVVPGDEKGGILPINRTMFHGTSLFEVVSEQGGGSFNTDIMRLQQTGNTKVIMADLMRQINTAATNNEATFRCVPDNVDVVSSVRTDGAVMEAYISRTRGKRNVDFADWSPELPHTVGLYQAFCRGYQKDTRAHKLFIGVNGGMQRFSIIFNRFVFVGAQKALLGGVAKSHRFTTPTTQQA